MCGATATMRQHRVEITVDIDCRTGEHFHEQFCEYTYDLDTIRTALKARLCAGKRRDQQDLRPADRGQPALFLLRSQAVYTIR